MVAAMGKAKNADTGAKNDADTKADTVPMVRVHDDLYEMLKGILKVRKTREKGVTYATILDPWIRDQIVDEYKSIEAKLKKILAAEAM